MKRALVIGIIAAAVVLAPAAAGASTKHVVLALNRTDGRAVVEASAEYRTVTNGVVDQVNYAGAGASCVDCQTVAAAYQIVLVTKDWRTFKPRNEAAALNVKCDECLTWAAAKQVIVATGGPATLTDAGRARLGALEARVEALEPNLATMSLETLIAELDAAYAELLAIAQEEVVRTDGGQPDAELVAARST